MKTILLHFNTHYTYLIDPGPSILGTSLQQVNMVVWHTPWQLYVPPDPNPTPEPNPYPNFMTLPGTFVLQQDI